MSISRLDAARELDRAEVLALSSGEREPHLAILNNAPTSATEQALAQ